MKTFGLLKNFCQTHIDISAIAMFPEEPSLCVTQPIDERDIDKRARKWRFALGFEMTSSNYSLFWHFDMFAFPVSKHPPLLKDKTGK